MTFNSIVLLGIFGFYYSWVAFSSFHDIFLFVLSRKTGAGCHILGFLVTVSISVSRNMFPWLYFLHKFEAIAAFGSSDKKVLPK